MQNKEEIIKSLDGKPLSEAEDKRKVLLEKVESKVLSFDEKLKMAAEKSGLSNMDEGTKLVVDNITGTTVQSNNNIYNVTSENITIERNQSTGTKCKKIFRIKKYVRYNKYLAEIFSDEELSENDQKTLMHPNGKKISPFSKVNFSKLKVEEKDERLKNLAKLVKRLRRRVRNLEQKVRFNATKLLNKYIWNKLGINTKNKYLKPEFQFDFDNICKALKKVRNHERFEFDDQKHLIENIINMVADDKLKLDSLAYRKICSILRTLIPTSKIKSISKKDSRIKISFPEIDVFITNKEYSKLSKFKDNEEILRAVLGVYDAETEKTIKITAKTPITNEESSHPQPVMMSQNNRSKPFIQEHQNQIINPSIFQQFIPPNPNDCMYLNGFMGGMTQMNPVIQNNGLFSNLTVNESNPINNLLQNNSSNISNIGNPHFQQLLLQSYNNYFQNSVVDNSNMGNIGLNLANSNMMSSINNNTSYMGNVNSNTANSNQISKPNNVFIK